MSGTPFTPLTELALAIYEMREAEKPDADWSGPARELASDYRALRGEFDKAKATIRGQQREIEGMRAACDLLFTDWATFLRMSGSPSRSGPTLWAVRDRIALLMRVVDGDPQALQALQGQTRNVDEGKKSEVRAAIDYAMEHHAAAIDYLADKDRDEER